MKRGGPLRIGKRTDYSSGIAVAWWEQKPVPDARFELESLSLLSQEQASGSSYELNRPIPDPDMHPTLVGSGIYMLVPHVLQYTAAFCKNYSNNRIARTSREATACDIRSFQKSFHDGGRRLESRGGGFQLDGPGHILRPQDDQPPALKGRPGISSIRLASREIATADSGD